MKNTILFALLSVALIFTGCKSDETDFYSTSTTSAQAAIPADELVFDGKMEEGSIHLDANFWWKASVVYPTGTTEQWCVISPTSGFGDVDIEVTSTRNYQLTAARSATIVVESDTPGFAYRKEFTVTQKPSSPYIEVEEVANAGTLDVPVVDYTSVLDLMANDSWTAAVSGTNTGWCTVTPSGQAGQTDFAVNYQINATGAPRSATVTVTLANNSATKYIFTVKQGDIFDKTVLTVTKSPTEFKADWTPVVGAAGYKIEVYNASNTLVGTLDAGTATSKNLAADPFFAGANPTYAGYVSLVVRTLSSDVAVYSDSDPVVSNSHFTSGKGTQAEPFMIGDIQSLQNITPANTVAANAGAYYTLNYTPTLPGVWTPICTPAAPFKGIFNGNGKTITGWVHILEADTRNYTGLFGGIASGASVSNLTFTNCSIDLSKGSGSVSATNNGFAFLAASNAGTVSNITVNNSSLNCTSGTTPVYAAAIAAVNTGTVQNCTTQNGILSAASSRPKADVFVCGSIAATNSATGTVTGCANKGTEIFGRTNIGGLVGMSDGAVLNSYNTGRITGTYYFGGIVGYVITSGAANFRIDNCYNTGEVIMQESGAGVSDGAAYVGGIVSRIHTTNANAVTNCYYSGNMTINKSEATGTSAMRIGGLVGHINNTGAIRNCYFRGKITINDGALANAGGLVGEIVGGKAAPIENCYSVGQLVRMNVNASSNINDAFGSFASGPTVVITSVYALSNGGTAFAGPNAPAMTTSGTRTVAELQGAVTATTFVGWNFTDTWLRNTTGDYLYPTLRKTP